MSRYTLRTKAFDGFVIRDEDAGDDKREAIRLCVNRGKAMMAERFHNYTGLSLELVEAGLVVKEFRITCGLQHLKDLQKDTGEWADTTFPESTDRTIIDHLSDEVGELIESDYAGQEEEYAEEAADCLLLLLHLAHKMGFDLMYAAEKKLVKNKRRTWETTKNARGYFRHIETPET